MSPGYKAKILQRAVNKRLEITVSAKKMQTYLQQASSNSIARLLALCLKEQLILPCQMNSFYQKRMTLTHIKLLKPLLYQLIKKNLLTLSYQNWQRFYREFCNGAENEAIFLAYRHDWRRKLTVAMEKSNTNNFWQWLISHKNQYHYLSLLEQWGSIGHPTHPNPKTKIELSLPEVLRYSPDLNSEFVISFAALHRSCAYQQNQDKSNNINQIFANQFPDVYANWHHALLENDCHPENYWIVPVHPWQKRNILLKKFQPLIQQKKLLFLAVVLPVKPTASFRTLIAASPHSSPHIKLPLGVRITSVPRTVSPGTTRMSPRMSDLLEKILLQENHFSKRLYFCRDMAGVHVTHPHAAHDDLRHLSTLIRENPLTLIDQDDIIVPLTALFANSPGSSAPLLHEIMQTAKIENMIEPLPYFFNYIHITLQAILDLYLIYGIALEAHKQNTLLVFKNNNPTRIIYRDFGGIRIHYPTLQAQHYSLEIDVPTLIVTDDEKAARHKIIHTVYQDHFISLVNFFHYYYSIEKNILWRAIAQETQQRFYSVRERISPQRYQQEYQGILQENWLIKSFTRMRLHNTNDYIHIDSGENPLRMN